MTRHLALAALTAVFVSRRALAECDTRLRRWYDENHGNRVMN